MRAQYADLLKQQKEATHHLQQQQLRQQQAAQQVNQQQMLHLQQQRQRQAQEQAAAEIRKYQQQIAQAAAQVKATQEAIRQQLQQPHLQGQTPRFPAQGAQPSPTQGGNLTPAPVYEYFTGSDGQSYKVLKTAAIPTTSQPGPQPTRLEYRCSPVSGRLYQVEIPVNTQLAAGRISPLRWHKDQTTGLMYQVPVVQQQFHQQVLPQQTPSHPQLHQVNPAVSSALAQPWQSQSVQQVAGLLPRQTAGLLPQAAGLTSQQRSSMFPQQGTVQTSQHLYQDQFHQEDQSFPSRLPPQETGSQGVSEQLREKMKGIAKLVETEGERKPKLLDYVKKCPAKWSQQVKLDTMNLPIYGWGALAEIIASLTGRGDSFPEGVLLAKLQHIQSVFEVCCLNATATEFSNYGWVLARNYASKVQAKMDQQVSNWCTAPPGVQTAELVSAQMEYPRPQEKKIEKPPKNGDKSNQQLCSSYNTCTTEGKCEFETAYPGRTCQRKHECSWCKKNLNKSHQHQLWKCAKKVEAGH